MCVDVAYVVVDIADQAFAIPEECAKPAVQTEFVRQRYRAGGGEKKSVGVFRYLNRVPAGIDEGVIGY
jgi:hypothetical protein